MPKKDFEKTAEALTHHDQALKLALFTAGVLTMFKTKRLGPLMGSFSAYLSGLRQLYLYQHKEALAKANIAPGQDPYPGFFNREFDQQIERTYGKAKEELEKSKVLERLQEFCHKFPPSP